jgi:hypothetical protein
MHRPRVDLYGTVHKALRARLFDLAVEIERCDFDDPADVTVAKAALRRTFGFLREHHRHEDDFVAPVLVRLGIARDVEAQHHASARAIEALEELATRADAGTRLPAAYRTFLLDYLQHMHHEENVVNAALWERGHGGGDHPLPAEHPRLDGAPGALGRAGELLPGEPL